MSKDPTKKKFCDLCSDTLVVPGRGGAPAKCPRCAIVLQAGLALSQRPSMDGTFQDWYQRDSRGYDYGSAVRQDGENFLQGFLRLGLPESPVPAAEELGNSPSATRQMTVEDCSYCEGTGEDPGDFSATCPQCLGDGQMVLEVT